MKISDSNKVCAECPKTNENPIRGNNFLSIDPPECGGEESELAHFQRLIVYHHQITYVEYMGGEMKISDSNKVCAECPKTNENPIRGNNFLSIDPPECGGEESELAHFQRLIVYHHQITYVEYMGGEMKISDSNKVCAECPKTNENPIRGNNFLSIDPPECGGEESELAHFQRLIVYHHQITYVEYMGGEMKISDSNKVCAECPKTNENPIRGNNFLSIDPPECGGEESELAHFQRLIVYHHQITYVEYMGGENEDK